MKILFLILMLSFAACSHTEIAEQTRLQSTDVNLEMTSVKYLPVKSMFDHEASYIKTIAEPDFKLELKTLLNIITKISYAENNCARGQVACSDGSHEGVIFINDNFFLMTQLEQFTAVLHEAAHLQSKNFEHIKCSKVPAWGYECDENVISPYGIEYKYMLHKYMHTKDDTITQLLMKIYNRINKI